MIVAIWVVAVPQVLRILPSTATIGAQLTGLVLAPLAGLWEWFSVNLANFATIGLVIGVAALLIRLSRIVFDEVARGTITIRGFEAAWASYTHHLATFLVVIAAAIIAFPYSLSPRASLLFAMLPYAHQSRRRRDVEQLVSLARQVVMSTHFSWCASRIAERSLPQEDLARCTK